MIKENFIASRETRCEIINADLVIVGGGLAGTCAAITAARAGISVVLVQDRPVLGGNSSSEVRLWILGASSHMGNNNRWAREGGLIDELLVENTFRNPEGNPVLFDTILLEKVATEPNIRLLLNTAVYNAEKAANGSITTALAYCSQNSISYQLNGAWFCDASGDGLLAFAAGAAFRMGAESSDEFGEKFAPQKEYGELLGHTIYFYSKDTGRPVNYIPPAYALADITKIPRYRSFNAKEHGCQLWWIEYGGRLDTIHETETIKWELWKVVYGVWNYIKNSGKFPEAKNLTLEWVGNIPGKRESRRFEGEYILKQQDLVEQRTFDDAVTYGGWSIDLHPADGVFSEKPGCNQWHTKGVYQIPLRCFYNHQVPNLFFAGRIISASHVAFGSSRVMGTCAHGGQAVGMAAALAVRNNWSLAELEKPENVKQVQQQLLRTGHYIPGVPLADRHNLAGSARITASSELNLYGLPFDGPELQLDYAAAQLLPLAPGKLPKIKLIVTAKAATTIEAELRISSKAANHTPDRTLHARKFALNKGENAIEIDFDYETAETRYVFICLLKNDLVTVRCSSKRLTGVLTVFNKINPAVSNYGKQAPADDIGIETFEFWCPQRRPAGHNFGFELAEPVKLFTAANLNNGWLRPTFAPHAWVADFKDSAPQVTFHWDEIKSVTEVILAFDTDYDHPMESSLMGHPETRMPFCVKRFEVYDDAERLLYACEDNHQAINVIRFPRPVLTSNVSIKLFAPAGEVPAALFEVQLY
jgi:hypothetical protein